MRAVWTVLFFVVAVALRPEHSLQDAAIHDHSEHVEASASSEQKVQGDCRARTKSNWAKKCPGKEEKACKAAPECKWCGTFGFC
mmetsp:Transcript_63863/g.139984  ORF Transcript_63863/g.139984 Transcript_63863/m.139984 type:complete len:84 (+) Transcript_63863:108-359(+)